jgi:hypothetical protein
MRAKIYAHLTEAEHNSNISYEPLLRGNYWLVFSANVCGYNSTKTHTDCETTYTKVEAHAWKHFDLFLPN